MPEAVSVLVRGSEEFEVKVGVHQGSVFSQLLFIIVLEALSREFRCGVPWEDPYADDLVIIAESMEECVRRLLTWKGAMEEKRLRVNAGKTKIMICGMGADLLQRAMLHASETWPLTKTSLQHLQRNDKAMIRQICNVKRQDTANIGSTELLALLSTEDLDLILKERRLCWYGLMERSNGAVKTAFDIQIVGKRGPGRPKMTLKQLTERDCREWKLSAIDPHDRDTWRSGLRSDMRAASQLPGRGPPVVEIASVHAC